MDEVMEVTVDDEANPVEMALDPHRRLIGASGRDILGGAFSSLSDGEEIIGFARDFRDLHCLHNDTIDPVLPLLKMGGISSGRVASETLAALIETMKRQIASLEQETLDLLLDNCFTYLTVPQLAPIAITVLERLRFVDGDTWYQIVQNGLDEPSYTDLPLSVKKRLWVSQTKAFDHEVMTVLRRVPESSLQPSFESFVMHPDRAQARQNDKHLKELMRLVTGVDDDLLAQAIEKMIESAGIEESVRKRTALADLFHDFLCNLPSRSSVNLASLRRMAKFLANRDGVPDLDDIILQEVRDAFTDLHSAAAVGLLSSSSYSRDFLAEQLVVRLLNRRGPLGDSHDPQILKAAANHVREDPCIKNLTFLCMCNMRASALPTESYSPSEDEVDVPFQRFYPFMISEMDSDNVNLEDHYYHYNGSLPNPALLSSVSQGWFERRVITSYCLLLYAHGNAVGLSRFRLVLDAICRASDQDQVREGVLASNLILKSIEEMK